MPQILIYRQEKKEKSSLVPQGFRSLTNMFIILPFIFHKFINF